ncbi:MAG: DUF4340 domain-containing protein [Saprospiraceae bacterium]|nr:DUF4340 domain-containing protein [Saprospiraceae bacterium]
MRKNKNLILLVIFALLGGLSYYLIKNKSTKTNIDTWDRNFAVKNSEEITKVFLSQKNGNNILLTKNGNHWIINNKYKVFPNTMQHLLNLLQNIKVNSIPHKNAYSVIMNEFASIGIKVEVYEGEEKTRTYYVGGVTEDESGLYCLMEGSEQPYIMKDNKAPANLRVRFDIKEVDWRDRSVFSVKTDEISKIKIDYPRNKSMGFTISKNDKSFQLTDSDNKNIDIKNSKIIKNFLSEFEPIQAEAIVNDHRAIDSINNLVPYVSYEIHSKNQATPLQLKLYPVNENVETPVDLREEFLNRKNFFRFYVVRSDGDFLLLQKPQIENVFFDLPEFLQKINK